MGQVNRKLFRRISVLLTFIGKPAYYLLVSLILLLSTAAISLITFSERLLKNIRQHTTKVESVKFPKIFLNRSQRSLSTSPFLRIKNTQFLPHLVLYLHQILKTITNSYRRLHLTTADTVTSILASLKHTLSLTKRWTSLHTHIIHPYLPRLKLPSFHPFAPPPFPRLSHPHLRLNLPHLHIAPPRFTPIFTATLATLLIFSAGSIFAYYYVFQDLPTPQDLITHKPPVTTKIYDRNHRLLYKIYDDQNRSLISLNTLPHYIVNATLAIEDADFYNHVGFSLRGIVRALRENLTGTSLQGGSTITQQLVKIALLTPERTLQRKLKELVLALEVEQYFTKDEILTMYFNQVGYGGPAYGIEEAAQLYFGKSAKDLTLGQAALLAGLPASPTIYSPYGSHPELAITRQHEVLRRMVEEHFITQTAADTAKAEPLAFVTPTTSIEAPHFVMYIKDLLAQTYGDSLVDQGGLNVTTSLDLDMQTMAQTVVSQELAKLQKLHITNAAVLVTKPRTGEVLAMVGSGNYFDIAHDGQVNVTLRPRQPGSSIKPLMYSLALEDGYTAATIIDDSPATFRVAGSPPYTPVNYDGRFHGKVPLRLALANSYNIPAVKTLSQIGIQNFADHAAAMGITTWTDPSRFGLSLTLGSNEVKMVDMAVAYGTLANYGHRVDLHPILSVTDIANKSLEQFACNPAPLAQLASPVSAVSDQPGCLGDPVIGPGVAYIITNILSDNTARSQAFGTNSVLNIAGYRVAVKTGTTNNMRDNWTFGYTPDYLVAVWVGNNDNSPMSYVASGITGASPIWARIMTSLLKNSPTTDFIQPSSVINATICPLTDTLSCGACPNTKSELFIQGTQPQKSCSDDAIHQILNPTPSPNPDQPRDQILTGAATTPAPAPQVIDYQNPPTKLHPTKHSKPRTR